MKKYEVDLEERLIDYAITTFELIKTIPRDREFDVFRYQLSKSVTSIGANYSESQVGTSKEFYSRINICLREARESHFWFRILGRLNIGNTELSKKLMQEAKEVKLIFGSIACSQKKSHENK